MKKFPLHYQIFAALFLSIPLGFWFHKDGILDLSPGFEFVGTFFLNALKMLIVPLIVSSIISGMSQMGTEKGFARLGGKTLAYYASTSFIAILVGLVLVNITQPGIVDGQPAKEIIGLSDIPEKTMARVEGKSGSDIVAIFLRMVPTNIVGAAAQGQMLGLITFSLLFGFFMTRLPGTLKEPMILFWNGVNEVMMAMTNFIMKMAPIGVLGLVANTLGKTGFSAFGPLIVFFFTVLGALAVHMFLIMPVLLKFLGGVSPKAHFQGMASALLTAFSTSSSAATLPKTMDCLNNKAKVSNRVSSFTVPLGATVNMDGTALYECIAALFIAQAYGLDITIGVQFTVVLVALLTSIGVAGIPSASLVAIVLILNTIGLPIEGIGLILAVDRILDMCRTSVNVFSDSCGAVLIAKSEGENPYPQGA